MCQPTVPLSLDLSLPNLLRRTHLAFLQVLEGKLREHQLPLDLWKYLRAFWDEDGISAQQLSERLEVSMSVVSQALMQLEGLGLVMYRSGRISVSDSRQAYLTLEGARLKSELGHVPREIVELSLERLSPIEQAELWRLLTTVFDTLQAKVHFDDGIGSTASVVPRS